MSCCGEILLSDPEPMEWEGVQVEEPMDWLQAEEPMEWEETPLEVSQPSTSKVDSPGLQEDSAGPRKVKRRPSFDSSEEEEVADDHKRRA
ncbi:hypothetical protein CEXT_6771 [Caerostris extrusa]|uniref:Uncharacterized protein n=1 Tax=Caerostris extrusa TaxID=172846 RepID=A0AAV4XJJ7_CAEEX|nr:hypothetical protein CEXT_6771 [Caerostris extrusa]